MFFVERSPKRYKVGVDKKTAGILQCALKELHSSHNAVHYAWDFKLAKKHKDPDSGTDNW
jgi:hypothetical protein